MIINNKNNNDDVDDNNNDNSLFPYSDNNICSPAQVSIQI